MEPLSDLAGRAGQQRTITVMDNEIETGVERPNLWRVAAGIGVVALLIAGGYMPFVVTGAVLLAMITVHEAGHFVAAKLCGIRATAFFVGFGPRLWSFKRGDTEYGLKALPLGGYVRIVGMSSQDADAERGYGTAPRWKRAVVVAAGPGVNLATAVIVAFFALSVVGVGVASDATLGSVTPDSNAQQAGLVAGDVIVAVDGNEVDTFAEVVQRVAAGGATVDVEVLRDNEFATFEVAVERVDDVARIGVSAQARTETLSVSEAVPQSLAAVGDIGWGVFSGLGGFVTGLGDTFSGLWGDDVALENRPLSPIGAVQIGADVGGQGLGVALWLIVMYSVFLAIFNLLPIPPLDGGHLAVNAFEAVASKARGRQVVANPNVVGAVATTFVVLILFVSLSAVVLDLTQPILNQLAAT